MKLGLLKHPLVMPALVVFAGFLVYSATNTPQAVTPETREEPFALLWGDVDRDGIVTELDADKLSEYVAGNVEASSINLAVADVNQDGKVSGADSLWISQYAKGTRSHLGPTSSSGGS